jgi:hypothetical protein
MRSTKTFSNHSAKYNEGIVRARTLCPSNSGKRWVPHPRHWLSLAKIAVNLDSKMTAADGESQNLRADIMEIDNVEPS